MRGIKLIFKEIVRQLNNIPSFALSPEAPGSERVATKELSAQLERLEKAVKERKGALVFIIGPFGSGKTTLIKEFLKGRKGISNISISLFRVNGLEYAFLNLMSFMSRLLLMGCWLLLTIFLTRWVPQVAAWPLLLLLVYFFAKSGVNLLYILHQSVDNIFVRRERLYILEDLERSSLGEADRWALLANLWQYKRAYIVSLGYSPDNRSARFKMIEYAMKLDGAILELQPSAEVNFQLIKKLDGEFPFLYLEEERAGWLSLLTPRETQMIVDQALLYGAWSKVGKQLFYISLCLEFLCKRLGIPSEKLSLDEAKKEIRGFSEDHFSTEQALFLSSFIRSIDPSVGVHLKQERSPSLH